MSAPTTTVSRPLVDGARPTSTTPALLPPKPRAAAVLDRAATTLRYHVRARPRSLFPVLASPLSTATGGFVPGRLCRNGSIARSRIAVRSPTRVSRVRRRRPPPTSRSKRSHLLAGASNVARPTTRVHAGLTVPSSIYLARAMLRSPDPSHLQSTTVASVARDPRGLGRIDASEEGRALASLPDFEVAPSRRWSTLPL